MTASSRQSVLSDLKFRQKYPISPKFQPFKGRITANPLNFIRVYTPVIRSYTARIRSYAAFIRFYAGFAGYFRAHFSRISRPSS
jgi:hypothetical protein